MKNEEQIIAILNAIINSDFDCSSDVAEKHLDECAETLEYLGLMDAYDNNRNSILHKAADHCLELWKKDSEASSSVETVKEWLKSSPSEVELKDEFWKYIESMSYAQAKLIASELNNVCFYGNFEYTPLHDACKEANLDAVKILIEAGFDKNKYFELIDHCSDMRGTPLTEALNYNASEVVEYFLTFDDLDVVTCGYSKSDDTPYWANGCYDIPFNLLFDTPHINRVVGLGASPNDCEPEDSLLWKVYRDCDIDLLKKLISFDVDLNISNEYDTFLHLTRVKYEESGDSKWLDILALMLKSGVDITAGDYDGYSFIERVIESGDEKLLQLVGLSKGSLENVAEQYIKPEEDPLANYPHELFYEDENTDDVCQYVIKMVMDGQYGWKKTKLTRILNLAIGALYENACGPEDHLEHLENLYDDIEYAQLNAFRNQYLNDPEALEVEFRQFIQSLDEEGKLDNPDKSLITALDQISDRLRKPKTEIA